MPTNRSTTKSLSRRILHLSLLSTQPEESANGTEELAVKAVETLDLSFHSASEARAAQCDNSGCGRSNIDTYQNKGNSNVHEDFEGPTNDELSMSTLPVTDIAESKSMKVILDLTLTLIYYGCHLSYPTHPPIDKLNNFCGSY